MKKASKTFGEIVSSKAFLGIALFLIIGFTTVFAEDIIFKEGSVEIQKNFNITDSMFVNSSSGYVGIGTESPTAKLDINGYIGNGGSYTALNVFAGGADSVNGLVVNLTNDGQGGYAAKLTSDTAEGGVFVGYTGPYGYAFEVESSGDNNIFVLDDSDGVCIAQPESGGLTWSCSSDRRLKKDIVDASSVLDYIRDIVIRDYVVKTSGDNMTGVIAQEIMKTHPELVTVDEDGTYMVSSINTWKLVKAIQELDQMLNESNSRIDTLEEELCKKDNTYSWC